MLYVEEVIVTKGHAIAALVVLSLLLSSTLLVAPVSATMQKVQPAPQTRRLGFFQNLGKTLKLIQSDVPDNLLALLTALRGLAYYPGSTS